MPNINSVYGKLTASTLQFEQSAGRKGSACLRAQALRRLRAKIAGRSRFAWRCNCNCCREPACQATFSFGSDCQCVGCLHPLEIFLHAYPTQSVVCLSSPAQELCRVLRQCANRIFQHFQWFRVVSFLLGSASCSLICVLAFACICPLRLVSFPFKPFF